MDLKDLDQEYIFSQLVGRFSIRGKVRSPFQQRDRTPNCRIYNNNGVLLLRDFSSGKSYTCVQLYSTLHNITIAEAYKIVQGNTISSDYERLLLPQSNNTKIIVPNVIKWDDESLDYWYRLGIAVEKYPVSLLNGYTMNDTWYNVNRLGFCYHYDNAVKIYCPANKYQEKSFIGNVKGYQSWTTPNSNILLVSKAAKEDMFFRDRLNAQFSYRHLQSESNYKYIADLQYDTFILNFDNDSVGKICYNDLAQLLINKGKTVVPLFSPLYKNFTDYPIWEQAEAHLFDTLESHIDKLTINSCIYG